MSELQPCPFCGSANVRADRIANNPCDLWSFGAGCLDCYAEAPTAPFDSLDAAITAWNRRDATITQLRAELERVKGLIAERDEQLLLIAGSMRNFAGVADSCDITLANNVPASLNVWADLIDECRSVVDGAGGE